MPDISTMGNSRYLKKDEVQTPTEYTVTEVVQENVAMDNQPEQMKWVMKFKEIEKGLVMNKTNLENGAFVSGKQNTDDWAGQKFTLFNDLSVVFGDKRGGIRIQVTQVQNTPNPAAGAAIAKATGGAPVDDEQPPLREPGEDLDPNIDENIPF